MEERVLSVILEIINRYENIFWLMSLISVFTFIGTLIAVPVLMIRLPVDYLITEDKSNNRNRHPVLQFVILVFKNVVGLLLILVGIALLVLPGEGVITILIGLAMMSIPQKAATIKKFIHRKKILRKINWIRAKMNKPALQTPESNNSEEVFNCSIADDNVKQIIYQCE